MPTPDLIDSVIKFLERFGLPTGIVIYLLWLLNRRGGTAAGRAEGNGVLAKVHTELATLRQRLDTYHDEFVILKARVGPLLSVLDSRLAAMFHQRTNSWGLDDLIERYRDDPSDTKERITDEELDRLIYHMEQWYARVKKDGPEPNQAEELGSSLWWVLMQSIRDVRRELRERARHEAEERQQRNVLTRYLREAQTGERPVATRTWWTRLRNWLDTSSLD
jgi:hypothetical protein